MIWQRSTDNGKTWHPFVPKSSSVLVNCPQSFRHVGGIMDDECGNLYKKPADLGKRP